jgi:hypothetical protein
MQNSPQRQSRRILGGAGVGPDAQDDEFGSRSIDPMELHPNQVTRAHGSFWLHMFHRSWSIRMIQKNISARRPSQKVPSGVCDGSSARAL